MIYWIAFSTGILGSLHCMGMCGPLVLALPQSSGHRALIYHIARIMAYATLGVLMGLLGQSLNWAGLQQSISIGAGILIVLLGFGLLKRRSSWPPFMMHIYQRIYQKEGLGASFGMGYLNGLLPCGMVYVALSASLAAGSIWSSMSFMLVFGLGTWPMMLGISWSKKLWKPSWRVSFNKWVPVLTVVIGLLFVLRGLNLGIPFLSPQISQGNEIECCTKPGH